MKGIKIILTSAVPEKVEAVYSGGDTRERRTRLKQYGLDPVEETFDWGVMNVIRLGERGRGRKSVLVPVVGVNKNNYVEIGLSKTNRPKIVKSNSDEGWLARISTYGCYTRNTYGSVSVPEGRTEEVAAGYGAEGAAGRLGTWDDLLLKIQDDTLVRVKPSGGCKRPSYYLAFTATAGAKKISSEEIDIFLDANPEYISQFEEIRPK